MAGTIQEDVEMVAPDDPLLLPFDPSNGTRLFNNIDYTTALTCVFLALLGHEEVTDWRRKNKQRKRVCIFFWFVGVLCVMWRCVVLRDGA